MKMNPALWLVIAVVIFGGVYAYMMMKPAAPAPAPVASPTQVVSISLGEQSDLGQSGTANLTENADGKLVVTLTLSGGTFTAPQPAHIHIGACPAPGAVEYPLTNVVDGKSVTTLAVGWSELKAGGEPMAINVHKSAAEASVYTACGNIPLN